MRAQRLSTLPFLRKITLTSSCQQCYHPWLIHHEYYISVSVREIISVQLFEFKRSGG